MQSNFDRKLWICCTSCEPCKRCRPGERGRGARTRPTRGCCSGRRSSPSSSSGSSCGGSGCGGGAPCAAPAWPRWATSQTCFLSGKKKMRNLMRSLFSNKTATEREGGGMDRSPPQVTACDSAGASQVRIWTTYSGFKINWPEVHKRSKITQPLTTYFWTAE